MNAGRVALVAAFGLACAQGPSSSPASKPAGSPKPSATLSVSDFGARGDGRTLDTAAIQSAVDALPPGGLLRFPAGTYRIESDKGIELKDDVRLDLGQAVLVGANVDGARCRLISVEGSRNVAISGGTLVGSRSGSPDWGVGIYASDAVDLLIENVTVRDFYFDGILLTGNSGCERVTIRGVVAQNNRRTGLAVPFARGVAVEDSTFSGTHGQSPEAGANFEPNRDGEVRSMHIRRSTFADNAGVGLYIHRAKGVAAADASVEDSVVTNNGQGIVMVGVEGISILNNRVSGHGREATSAVVFGDTAGATVTGNQLEGNFRGIMGVRTDGATIAGNTVVGTGAAAGAGPSADANGIVCLGPSASTGSACAISGNTVKRFAGSGVVAQQVSLAKLRDNTIQEVGQRAVLLRATSHSEVVGNSVSASGLLGGEFPAIELIQSSSDNVIATNVVRLGTGSREAIAVCPACRRNEVTGNVVLP
jgi:parallel beta-helix repeat protein